MQFLPTPIDGVFEVFVDWHRDERGDFGRVFCAETFAANGLNAVLSQCSVSSNRQAGTLRGFHFQTKPHQEAKLVQCIAGRVFDVALDLRRGSPTFGRHHAVELSPEAGVMLFVPEGCAHGFQTLVPGSTILYYISTPYMATAGRGVLWNDPAIAVPWPLAEPILSERDRHLPLLAECSGA